MSAISGSRNQPSQTLRCHCSSCNWLLTKYQLAFWGRGNVDVTFRYLLQKFMRLATNYFPQDAPDRCNLTHQPQHNVNSNTHSAAAGLLEIPTANTKKTKCHFTMSCDYKPFLADLNSLTSPNSSRLVLT